MIHLRQFRKRPNQNVGEQVKHCHEHRRRVVACTAGVSIMLFGASVSVVGHIIFHEVFHMVIIMDTIGYGLHGIGLIPMAKFVEPFV